MGLCFGSYATAMTRGGLGFIAAVWSSLLQAFIYGTGANRSTMGNCSMSKRHGPCLTVPVDDCVVELSLFSTSQHLDDTVYLCISGSINKSPSWETRSVSYHWDCCCWSSLLLRVTLFLPSNLTPTDSSGVR